jgi:PAS domain S-box-containing protein
MTTETDITINSNWIRKQKEHEENLARLQAFSEVASCIFWEFDIPADRWSFVSSQSERILGYMPEEWKDRQWWLDRIHPEDREWVDAFCQKAVTRGVEHALEYRFVAKDGHTIWFYDVIHVEMKEHRPVKVRGSMFDITKRKQAEAALQDSEEKFKAVVNGSINAVLISSPDVEFLSANPAACHLFQMTEMEIQASARDALVDESDPRFAAAWEERERSGKVTAELTFKKKDGTLFPAIAHSFVFSDSKGKTFACTIIRDLSEQKQADVEKAHLQNQLRQSQKMEAIGTLAGGIAHDFNNILTSILGYADLVLGIVEADSRVTSYVKEIQAAGYRAAELVRQILTFARQSEQDIKPILLHHIATEALKLLRSSIPSTIAIRQNLESRALVMADPSQIHQIFMNLCTNAIQAMNDENGVLTVSLTDFRTDTPFFVNNKGLQPGDYLKIMVTDTGCGISEKDVDFIFDPYYTTKDPGVGTGLGLAVVHGIVTGCGGEIFVDSAPGRGTTFTIYLPSLKMKADSAAEPEKHLQGGNESVLVVDDEAVIGRMCHLLLSESGYRVTFLSSSLEALEVFKRQPEAFDVVLTDMTMPEIRGDQLMIEMKKIRPDIPVILCSGYSRQISEEKAAEIGVAAYIRKPFKKEILVKTIRTVLAGQTNQ